MSRRSTRRRPQASAKPITLTVSNGHLPNGNGNGNGHHPNGNTAYAVLPAVLPEIEEAFESTPRGVTLDEPEEPLGLVVPGETLDLMKQVEDGTMASYCWKGRLSRRAWHYRVTAVIPHVETPELLPTVLELLRWQTERPYLMVIDTGSSREVLDQVEALRTGDCEIHYIRAHNFPHSSEAVACAMDLAFSLCRTEYLFATHVDCFLQRRDYLENLLEQCGPDVTDDQSPAVGYEMSNRTQWCGNAWRGMISHTASLFHMPTMHRIGASWGFHRGHTQFGENRDSNCWPDTETCFNHCLQAAEIKPRLIGQETNFKRYTDGNVDHVRSYPGAKILRHPHFEDAQVWMEDALEKAEQRADEWRSEALGETQLAFEEEIARAHEQLAEAEGKLQSLRKLYGEELPMVMERRRRNRLPTNTTYGRYVGQGKQFEDADTGWYYPERTHAHQQRGLTVSRFYRDGSRDRPDDYEG